MRSFVIVCLCLIAAASVSAKGGKGGGGKGGGKHGDHFKKFEECASELGHSKEDMKEMFHNKDPKLGCVIACVMKKEGIMENDEISGEKAAAKMKERHGKGRGDDDHMEEKAVSCAKTANKESDDCAKALSFMKCMKPPGGRGGKGPGGKGHKKPDDDDDDDED